MLKCRKGKNHSLERRGMVKKYHLGYSYKKRGWDMIEKAKPLVSPLLSDFSFEIILVKKAYYNYLGVTQQLGQ